MIIAKLFISGLPGSGKTTILKRYEGNESILTLDLDEIGQWTEGDDPQFLTDIDALHAKMGHFEVIQDKNKDQHYIFIVVGYSANILNVSKAIKGWFFVDMWLHATQKTLIKRLSERADAAADDNWWKLFKGKPDGIETIVRDLQDVDPKTAMFGLYDENILSYNDMVKSIDGYVGEMEAKPSGHGWIPETNDEEGISLETMFGFPCVNTMYFISAKRMIVVFDLVRTKTYCYWAVQGGEDHRIISSAKGPFDTSLTMEDDKTTWADTRVSEDYFFEQSGHTADTLKNLFSQYATAWMLNQNKLFVTKSKAK